MGFCTELKEWQLPKNPEKTGSKGPALPRVVEIGKTRLTF